MADRELTDAQRKALDDAEEYLGRAHDEARRRLAAAGFGDGPDTDPVSGCLQCNCDEFTQRPGGGRLCATPSCGHNLFSHIII